MNATPTKLEKAGDDALRIVWNDGETREYTFRELRDACPCATCRERRQAPPPPPNVLTVLSPGETQPLRLTELRPVGNYAYGLAFSDGHDTGIYTLELLKRIGRGV